MRTVVEIDKDITRLQKSIAQLESDRNKNARLLENATAIRERNALQSLTSSDPKDQDVLVKARSDQRQIEMLLADFGFAIGEAARQLEQLKTERAEAHRHERWLEFLKVAEDATGQAALIDAALGTLASLLTDHVGALRRLTQLSAEANRPRIFGLKHFWRIMNARFHAILPRDFPSQAAPYRAGHYEKFLREQIDSTGNSRDEVKKAV